MLPKLVLNSWIPVMLLIQSSEYHGLQVPPHLAPKTPCRSEDIHRLKEKSRKEYSTQMITKEQELVYL
jgi:hypothetical protein